MTELAIPGQQVLMRLPCAQLNVAEDSSARKYALGVTYDNSKGVEDDPAFYLFATAGIYHEQDILKLDPESTNWIGFVGIGSVREEDNLRDIVIAFRGTEVRGADELQWKAMHIFLRLLGKDAQVLASYQEAHGTSFGLMFLLGATSQRCHTELCTKPT